MKKKNITNLTLAKKLTEHQYSISQNIQILKDYYKDIFKAKDTASLKILSAITSFKNLISQETLLDNILTLSVDDENFHFIQLLIEKSELSLRGRAVTEILNEATKHGSKKLVKYLLDRKVHPENQDEHGENAFHCVAYSNNIEIFKLLIKKCPNPNWNVKDLVGNTPLHVAASLGHTEIRMELLKQKKIKKDIKNKSGKTYIQLLNSSEGKKLKQQLKVIKEKMIKLTQEDQALSLAKLNIFKSIFHPEGSHQYIAEALDGFKDILNTIPNSSKNDELFNLIRGKTVEIFKLPLTFSPGFFIQKVYSIINKVENPYMKSNIYHEIASILISLNNYSDASLFEEEAYKSYKSLMDQQKNVQYEYEILYNLGLAYKHINSKKAIEYLNQAEGLTTKQENLDRILELKISLLSSVGYFKSALNNIKKISNKDLKDLLTANILLSSNQDPDQVYNDTNLEKFITFNSSLTQTHPFLIYNTLIQYFISKKDFELALDNINVLIYDNDTIGSDILSLILKKLEIFQLMGAWEQGLKFINEANENYPMNLKNHTAYNYLFMEYLFHEKNELYQESSQIIDKLIKVSTNSNLAYKFAAIALKTSITDAITNQLFNRVQDLLLKFKNLVSNYKGNVDEERMAIEQYERLIEKIQTEQNPPLQIEENFDNEYEIKKNFYSNIDLLKLSKEEMDEAWIYLSAHMIRDYFKSKKNELTNIAEKISQNTNITSWLTPLQNKVIFSNDENIYNFDNEPNSYFYVPEKIFDKLDPIQRKQFKLQINKGLVTKNHSMNGLKIIKVPGTEKIALVEAKIDADIRIYGQKAFKNFEGKTIYILNKIGNHEKVANAALKPLKVLPVSSMLYEDEQLNNEDTFNPEYESINFINFNQEDDLPLLGDNF